MVYLFFLIATSVVNGGSGVTSIGLETVEKLAPGKTTKKEIKKLLGNPKAITDFAKLTGVAHRKDMGELWEYNERDLPRLAISFPPGSSILDGWVWNIYEGDPESNPQKAMKHFSTSSFTPESDKWINPHSNPQDCYFRDEKHGVALDYNRVRKKMYAIHRWDPSRKLASNENEVPPEFCIENACSPGVSPKHFFKDFPLSKYCELPE